MKKSSLNTVPFLGLSLGPVNWHWLTKLKTFSVKLFNNNLIMPVVDDIKLILEEI